MFNYTCSAYVSSSALSSFSRQSSVPESYSAQIFLDYPESWVFSYTFLSLPYYKFAGIRFGEKDDHIGRLILCILICLCAELAT